MATPKRKNPKSTAISYYDAASDTYPDTSTSTPLPITGSVTTDGLTDAELRAAAVLTSSWPYAIRMNDGATYLYIGKAATGSSTASAVWQVQRITQSDTTILWADGNGNFDNIWDNYASLSYS